MLKQLFIDSFLFPKKESILRLNKLDMRIATIHFFILLVILIVPLELSLYYKSAYKIQILIYYPFIMIFFGLIGMCFLSGIGLVISSLFKRRLKFQLVWKMTSFALTKPILVLSFGNTLIGSNKVVNVLVLLMIIYYILRMIIVFPRKKKQGTR